MGSGALQGTAGVAAGATGAGVVNLTSCQALANLCALEYVHFHALASVSASAVLPSCAAYLGLIEAERARLVSTEVPVMHGVPSWPPTMPWVAYPAEDPVPEVNPDLIRMRPSFGGEGDTMRLVAATYAVDGRYLGMTDLTYVLQLCVSGAARSVDTNLAAWTHWGTQYKRECELARADFESAGIPAAGVENLLFEPYFVDVGDELVPIPVLLADDGLQFEVSPSDFSSTAKYRRFALFDSISARAEGASSDAPGMIVVAALVRIMFALSPDNTILPPLISIHYEELDSDSTEPIEMRFEVEYLSSSEMRLEPWVATMGVLSFIFMTVDVRAQRRRDRELETDLSAALTAIGSWGGWFSLLLALVLVGSSIYQVAVAQASNDPELLPPTEADEDEELFEDLVYTGAAFQFLWFLQVVYRQTQTDIFLIDWEKRRGTAGVDVGVATGTAAAAAAAAAESKTGAVSVWRTLFVANEWNEIQTYRKVPYQLLLVGVYACLYVLDASDLASANAASTATGYDSEDSKVLRFGTAAALFLGVGVALWLLFFVVRSTTARCLSGQGREAVVGAPRRQNPSLHGLAALFSTPIDMHSHFLLATPLHVWPTAY